MTASRTRTLALGALVALGLIVTACGDDDESTASDDTAADTSTPATTAASATDQQAFCNGLVEIEAASTFGPETAEDATPEELAEVGKAFAAGLMPIAEGLQASAPADVATDIEFMVTTLEGVADTGDPSALESPEFAAADSRVHAASIGPCGWNRQDVELMDYHFMGVPATLEAGVTTFELKNNGKEFHEMILVRKNDGVTEGFEELLSLPEDQAMQKVAIVGAGFVPQGESGFLLSDLTPGEYLAVCFIPVGTVDPTAEPPADAPPHFTQGMQHPFTVAAA